MNLLKAIFDQEEKSIVHEEFMNNMISGELCELIGDVHKSMSVNIDLMNRREVERLRQVLRLWIREMLVLEIIFKVCVFVCFDFKVKRLNFAFLTSYDSRNVAGLCCARITTRMLLTSLGRRRRRSCGKRIMTIMLLRSPMLNSA